MDDKAKSRNYFNAHSSTGLNHNGYWNLDYRVTAGILRRRNVRSLMDIGCGNGAFLAYAKKHLPGTSLSGLDYSEAMVKRCQERLASGAVTQGDAENMPFPDAVCDGVSCHMSIHHYPHPERALAEMYRILEPGGTVLINDLTGPVWFRKLLNISFRWLNTGDHKIYSRQEMSSMLESAGFSHIKSRNLTPFTYVCAGRKNFPEKGRS